MNKIFQFIWTTLAYIIFPPLCPVCEKIVDDRGQICKSCLEKIYRLDAEIIFPDILHGVFIITKYREGTRNLLLKIKFQNNLKSLPTIKKILNATLNNVELNNFLAQTDLATFVPLHEKRFAERGFNQTELIFADYFAKKNLPIANLLVRHKPTPRLFKYKFSERKEILNGAFSIVPNTDIRGKKILLVDDIYTTGATVSECAKVLKDNGADKIFVLAFASDAKKFQAS